MNFLDTQNGLIMIPKKNMIILHRIYGGALQGGEMYKKYMRKFIKDGISVPCQLIYDWRAATGFVSGSDLHEIFNDLLGKPSPSGYETVKLSKISQNCILFRQATEAVDQKTFLAAVRYYNIELDFGIETVQTVKDVEELRRLIWGYFGTGGTK